MTNKITVRTATPSPLDGVQLSTVDEDSIRRLVHGFYDAVRRDDVIGPIFLQKIAPGRWPFHLNRMCDFWSSVLLRSGRYHGQPLPPHLRLPGLSDIHFARWLGLFRTTARQVFDEPTRRLSSPPPNASRRAFASPSPFITARIRSRSAR